jgi:hypothetical protein
MSEFVHEMFSTRAVVATGGALMIFGALFWAFPLTFKRPLAIRKAYADQLRASG